MQSEKNYRFLKAGKCGNDTVCECSFCVVYNSAVKYSTGAI